MNSVTVLITLIIGLTAGILSGAIVAEFYERKGDSSKLKSEAYDYYLFIDALKTELEKADFQDNNYSAFRNILNTVIPSFVRFEESGNNEKIRNTVADANKILAEIERKIETRELNPENIPVFKAQLTRAQFNILIARQAIK